MDNEIDLTEARVRDALRCVALCCAVLTADGRGASGLYLVRRGWAAAGHPIHAQGAAAVPPAGRPASTFCTDTVEPHGCHAGE